MAKRGSRMLAVQDMTNIHSDIIDTVFGYTREAKSGLNRRYVPMEISLICLSYYYWDTNEYFAIAGCSYQVSDPKNECPWYPGSAFGNVLISSSFGGIFTWKFKILSMGEYFYNPSIYIGITSEHEILGDEEVCLEDKDKYTYFFDDEAELIQNGKNISSRDYMDIYFGEGCTLTMVLDLEERTLKYDCVSFDEEFQEYQNEGFDDIACGLDIYYRMAVTLQSETNCKDESHKKTQIELVDFWFEE